MNPLFIYMNTPFQFLELRYTITDICQQDGINLPVHSVKGR